MAAKDTIVTFTSRSLEEILETGGSQKWKLRECRARYAKYLVCARHKYGEYGGGPEEHKTGFLLGKISGIVPAESDPSRYLVQINKWAEIDVPELWQGGRNPVRYATLEELGIDLEGKEWKSVKKSRKPGVETELQSRNRLILNTAGDSHLNVAQIIRDLAANLGVKADAIEITIRGGKAA